MLCEPLFLALHKLLFWFPPVLLMQLFSSSASCRLRANYCLMSLQTERPNGGRVRTYRWEQKWKVGKGGNKGAFVLNGAEGQVKLRRSSTLCVLSKADSVFMMMLGPPSGLGHIPQACYKRPRTLSLSPRVHANQRSLAFRGQVQVMLKAF